MKSGDPFSADDLSCHNSQRKIKMFEDVVAFELEHLPVLPSCQTEDYLLQPAKVIDSESDQLIVTTDAKRSCQQCASQGGCSMGLLNRIASEPRRLSISTNCQAPIGSWVWVGLKKNLFLKHAFLVYCLPTLLLLLGALLGFYFLAPFGYSDMGTGVGMILGLMTAAVTVIAIHQKSPDYGVVVIWPND